MNVRDPTKERDYLPLADHALIGNLRTAALVSLDGSVESYCIPNFDSPSVFARILDKHKGGHFSITPTVPFTTKQNYLPSSNVLQTKFLNDAGVATVTDFLPRQANGESSLFWLIRRVEVVRGIASLRMECAPAFNYARDAHTTEFVSDDSVQYCSQKKVLFKSSDLELDLRYVSEVTFDNVPTPEVKIDYLDLTQNGHLGPSACCDFSLTESQRVTFVLRICPDKKAPAEPKPTQELADTLDVPLEQVLIEGTSKLRPKDDPFLTKQFLEHLFLSTNKYWNNWIRKSTYQGSWKEAVHRSALALKLLIYEPTGAVVASPTFSLPEYIGGTRNWYVISPPSASWIRDSSFTLYALIRLGFTQEANAYLDFIFERLRNKNPDGSLQIMYTIHGGKDLSEIELLHLDGHKGSKPVRIGNGAADHIQLVGHVPHLMDCIYLGQKVPKLTPLESIWSVRVRSACVKSKCLCAYRREVRGRKRHFTVRGFHRFYGRVIESTGLRLADKRSLPCPNRNVWLAARDDLYEEIMAKAWNPQLKVFGQSYEETDVLDSSVLIMPLVFFMTPSDPRFVSTLQQILKSPERGGLTSNNLVYRYDVSKTDDGVGGKEGTFCLCTLWCVEALTRAGEFEKPLLYRAVSMFEDFLVYSNHVGLCTEEISEAGDALGNAVQGFTHVTLISAAYNLSRTLAQVK
ncbi:glycoside hydrolase family 15 protein [Scleroderma citrinum Foug A]|uniref:Glycoside hydrolase family 15 protein n=1 Tax=Scleroderma citrinum Foug A TaxID=1036808 RepID=A0A0C3A6I0_9AGAM|nr:glycoside hydrolase family 15 protein [Scleroderma citrinum Foug A]